MGWCRRLGLLGGLGLAGGVGLWARQQRWGAGAAPERQGAESGALELRLVQVLFRHGARTPLRPLPGAAPVSRGGLGVAPTGAGVVPGLWWPR